MSKSVIIEVTRGPLVESRHEGIAAIVRPDGTVVASWGDIDSLILPRSANKPIQAMAFVESGAVERYGLGNEHIALSCASHSGEKRHVETVQAWLAKVGLSEADLECGTHAPRLFSHPRVRHCHHWRRLYRRPMAAVPRIAVGRRRRRPGTARDVE